MFRKALLAAAVVAAACASAAGATTYSGTLNGSNYQIDVPPNWNGTLVVLAHGYRDKADHPGEVDDTRALDDDFAGIAGGLNAFGYATAGTSYRSNGWAVKDMIADVVDLREHFEATVGTPNRALLAGFSLGSFPTGVRAERGGFDGYLPMCGVLAGAPRAWDGAGAHLLAYRTAFGSMPAAWGTPADGDDDVDAQTEVFPTLIGNLTGPGGFGKFEFARIVAGVPLSPTYYPGGLFTNMFFQTEARGELERRAGGPVTQNLDHTYWVSPGDRLYLGALGIPSAQVDAWLATMNTTRFSAPNASRNYVEHYANFSGKIKRPVLTMHTVVDTLVPVNHEAAYAETVAAAGRSSLLRQWYTSGTTHCGFNFMQILSAVQALDSWVATGVAPSGPPPVPGFMPSTYSPPAWPQP